MVLYQTNYIRGALVSRMGIHSVVVHGRFSGLYHLDARMVLCQAGFFLPCWLLHLLVGDPRVPRSHHRRLVAWRQRVCDLRALLVPRVGVFVHQVVFVRVLVCMRLCLLVCVFPVCPFWVLFCDSTFCCGRFCVICPEFASRIVLLFLVLLGGSVG